MFFKAIYFYNKIVINRGEGVRGKKKELPNGKNQNDQLYLISESARTQLSTTKNGALESPTFGAIAGVSQTEVQWKGLALGEPPS